MDTYLEILKDLLSEGVAKVKIPVDSDQVTKIYHKISNFAFVRSYKLLDISPYLLLLILEVPSWRRRFVREVEIYCHISELFDDALLEDMKYPSPRTTILISSTIYYFAQKLPDTTQKELNEAILGTMTRLKERKAIDLDEQIAFKILDHFKREGKIDEDLREIAFNHFIGKKVVRKYQKGKVGEKRLPDSFDDFTQDEVTIPETFISYARTSLWRLREQLRKKSKKSLRSLKTNENLHYDSSIYELYDQIERQELESKVSMLVESILTDREKEVIKLEYDNELTQEEIAKKLKISQPMVSRHHKKAKDKLKKALGNKFK